MGRKRSESRVRTGDSHQIWCSVSSTTSSNAKKSSSLVKSTLRHTPRLSTWKTIPPGQCRLGRDIHGFLPRYPSFVNFVAVTFFHVTFSPPQIRLDRALAAGGPGQGPWKSAHHLDQWNVGERLRRADLHRSARGPA